MYIYIYIYIWIYGTVTPNPAFTCGISAGRAFGMVAVFLLTVPLPFELVWEPVAVRGSGNGDQRGVSRHFVPPLATGLPVDQTLIGGAKATVSRWIRPETRATTPAATASPTIWRSWITPCRVSPADTEQIPPPSGTTARTGRPRLLYGRLPLRPIHVAVGRSYAVRRKRPGIRGCSRAEQHPAVRVRGAGPAGLPRLAETLERTITEFFVPSDR